MVLIKVHLHLLRYTIHLLISYPYMIYDPYMTFYWQNLAMLADYNVNTQVLSISHITVIWYWKDLNLESFIMKLKFFFVINSCWLSFMLLSFNSCWLSFMIIFYLSNQGFLWAFMLPRAVVFSKRIFNISYYYDIIYFFLIILTNTLPNSCIEVIHKKRYYWGY